MEFVAILSRWTHISTAIVLVGGTCFLRFVLAPAAAQLPDEEHARLRERILATWKKFVMIGITLFLVTGFYNWFAVQMPGHQHDKKIYHMVIGTKVLIAFVIFFLASALTGRSKSFEGIRKNAKFWQGIIVLLAAVVVAISSYAKVAMPPIKPAQTEVQARG